MTVIAELTIPADAFELGRILSLKSGGRVSLESVVPMGDSVIPFVRTHDSDTAFADRVRRHPFVSDFHRVGSRGGQTLYAIDWSIEQDRFIDSILATDGQVIGAVGTPDRWQFELRLPSHAALSAFSGRCERADIPITVDRIYNPTNPDAGPFFGLTEPQRETLIMAVEAGYYSLPRQTVTKELGAELGISDQAVSERLRRAITNLVENTLLVRPDPAVDGLRRHATDAGLDT
jgi:predicted DNA binding protein